MDIVVPEGERYNENQIDVWCSNARCGLTFILAARSQCAGLFGTTTNNRTLCS